MSNLRNRVNAAINIVARSYGRRVSELTSKEDGEIRVQAMYGDEGPGKKITDAFATRLREHISGLNGMDSVTIESVFEDGVYAVKIRLN